jgi:hypothetical protein
MNSTCRKPIGQPFHPISNLKGYHVSGQAKKDRMQRGKKKIENIVKMFSKIYASQLGAINMNGGMNSVPIPS